MWAIDILLCVLFVSVYTTVYTSVYTTVYTAEYVAFSPPRKLRCCGAQLLHNFRVFLQARNFCHGAQLWLILDCFCGFLPSWRHFEAKWNMEPLSTHNLSEICSCLPENCDFLTHYFFHQWASVARLMTLQRSLKYRLSFFVNKDCFQR